MAEAEDKNFFIFKYPIHYKLSRFAILIYAKYLPQVHLRLQNKDFILFMVITLSPNCVMKVEGTSKHTLFLELLKTMLWIEHCVSKIYM